MSSRGQAETGVQARPNILDRAALAVAAAIHAALAWRLWFVCDDAFITFRYARNLARGLGLRFNPLESPPVEGYSNFLWTIACAGFEAAGLHPAKAAPALSYITAVLLLVLVHRTARKTLGFGPIPAAAAAFFLAASPIFAAWSSSGLETMPFALAMFLSFERLVLRPGRVDPAGGAAACLALSLLRFEGVFWALFLLGLALFHRRGRQRELARDLLLALALFLVPYMIYFGWRYSYFGEVWPNTVKAKASFSYPILIRGVKYVAWNMLTFVSLPLSLIGIATLYRKLGPRDSAPLVLFALALLAYPALVGGDFMAMGRFLVPALPLCALFFAGLAEMALPTKAGIKGAAAPCLIALALGALPAFDLGPMPGRLLMPFRFRNHMKTTHTEFQWLEYMRANAYRWTVKGRLLAETVPPEATITAGGIGAVAYYSGLHVIDRCGLTNPELAELEPLWPLLPGHDKCRLPDYFADERPDYLWSMMARDENDVRRIAGVTLEKDYIGDYVIEVVPVGDMENGDGGAGAKYEYLVLCRRLGPGESAESEWNKVRKSFPPLAPP